MPKQPSGFDAKSIPDLIPIARRVASAAKRVLPAETLESQNRLGEALGMKSGPISKLLRAHHEPGVLVVVDIAKRLGVSAGWLVAGEGIEAANDAPTERARAAAVALGFRADSIDAGLARAKAADTAWTILSLIKGEDEQRAPDGGFGSPKPIERYAKPDPTLKDKFPTPKDEAEEGGK